MQKVVYNTKEITEFSIWKYWGISIVAKTSISKVISDLCPTYVGYPLSYLDSKIIGAKNTSSIYIFLIKYAAL